MSFLLKKMIGTWNAIRDVTENRDNDIPVCPPTPDLSHLTSDEISAIHEVVVRQEEFERNEGIRINMLKAELDCLQHQLDQKAGVAAQDKKLVDLRLCRLCFKTKFNDGAGRVCDDCQQRVCLLCGSFSKSRWNIRKMSVDGRWRCKLCMVRREVLCRTGGWYHGTPADSTEQLKKKLSVASSPEGETEAQSKMFQNSSWANDGSQTCLSGNRTDSELWQTAHRSQNTRIPSATKQSRRQSLLPDPGDGDKKADEANEDQKGDKNSLRKLMLERQMSRRQRQEKRQRQKMKTVPAALRKPSLFDKSKVESADYTDSNSSPFASNSDSSIADSPSPIPLRNSRPNALAKSNVLNISSDVKLDYRKRDSTVSAELQRESLHESLSVRPIIAQWVKSPQKEHPDAQPTSDFDQKPLQRWRQSGFPNAYLIMLHTRPTGCPCDVKVTGGVQDDPSTTRAIVTSVSAEIKANVCVGQEVLEWNGETLRGQTYDYVNSITLRDCPRALLLLNPTTGTRQGSNIPCGDGRSVINPEQAASKIPDLNGKVAQMRVLPKTPMQRDACQTNGEIQMKLCYQPHPGTLSVTIQRARRIVSSILPDSWSPGSFVVVNLVSGRSGRASLETGPYTSDSHPDWNQVLVLNGVSLTEIVTKALQLTVWVREESGDQLIGEVLLDLCEAQLDNQPNWYSLEDHDENSSSLPSRRNTSTAMNSASWAGHSCKDSSTWVCPKMSPEVSSYRNSISNTEASLSGGSSNASPVPFVSSQIGSREFHLNSVSQPDSFTMKVRKKMRKTVSKMSPLSFMEKKDTAGSDDSLSSDKLMRLSGKSDVPGAVSRAPSLQKPAQSLNSNLDLLAPPRPASRTSSCSSIFMSDEEDIPEPYSLPPVTPGRLPPEGDDITSTLGPGQIPPKPSAETTVCGNIRLGFMVSKGQLEVDIVCAARLHWDGHVQPLDTYVKTHLVEGKKVIQSKKTTVVKTTADPGYHKKIKYSASNVHGRIMKIAIWKRGHSSDKKACLGEVLVRLDVLDLSKPTVAWYKLFQINSTEYGSDEFISSW